MVRWAILGVGTAGFARAKAIASAKDSELAAVYKGKFASRTQATIVDSMAQALELADAVAICSPSSMHPEQVEQCLEAGKHVVVEYPLAMNADQAASLYAIADRQERMLHVAHIELLGSIACTLRAHVHPAAVRTISVSFESTGADDTPGSDLPIRNLARLHRVVDVAGPIASIDSINVQPGAIDATFSLEKGARGALSFKVGSYYNRRTELVIDEGEVHWKQSDRCLYRARVPQTLIDGDSVFGLDHRAAMKFLTTSKPPYIERERVLHVLAAADMLRTGSTGPIRK